MEWKICHIHSRGENLFMIFEKTIFDDVYIIKPEKLDDERGFFARTWDAEIFEKKGLNSKIVQCSISQTKTKGTIRGLHYQIPPYQETKIIRCTKGKIFDIIIDLRINSSTYKKWESFDLNSENYNMLYIPEGFAHGFQSLEDNTEMFYQMTQFFQPEHNEGIRWNDPTFNIPWPLNVSIISKKDKDWKLI